MDLNIPALDLDTEEKGKWFTYRGAIQLRIARMNNDAYLAGATAMYAAQDAELKDTTEEQKANFMLALYARYILKDWKGVCDRSTGEVVAYTSDAGVALLADPRYKDLLSFILERARTIAEYWEEQTAAVGEE